MFGGKWMDIFVDKLSQKLTAAEMIKANAAADAAELQKAKGQVLQYDALLNEIREINTVNADSAKQVNTLVTESLKKLENVDKVNELIDISLIKIEEFKACGDNVEQLETQLTELKAVVEAMKTQMEELNEHVHKENVKVYRNVQAIVLEESAKLVEQGTSSATVLKKVSGKGSAALIFSIMTLIVTVAGLVLQILGIFGLI